MDSTRSWNADVWDDPAWERAARQIDSITISSKPNEFHTRRSIKLLGGSIVCELSGCDERQQGDQNEMMCRSASRVHNQLTRCHEHCHKHWNNNWGQNELTSSHKHSNTTGSERPHGLSQKLVQIWELEEPGQHRVSWTSAGHQIRHTMHTSRVEGAKVFWEL